MFFGSLSRSIRQHSVVSGGTAGMPISALLGTSPNRDDAFSTRLRTFVVPPLAEIPKCSIFAKRGSVEGRTVRGLSDTSRLVRAGILYGIQAGKSARAGKPFIPTFSGHKLTCDAVV